MPEPAPADPPPAPPGQLHFMGRVGALFVFTLHDPAVEPCHQWLLIPAAGGEALARLLYPDLDQLPGRGLTARAGFYRIPHTAAVDQALLQLVDLCGHIRYSAPELMQLRLRSE